MEYEQKHQWQQRTEHKTTIEVNVQILFFRYSSNTQQSNRTNNRMILLMIRLNHN